MEIDELKQSGSIIFECIAGSKAYGLDTSSSDTDIRGVFILPQEMFYSLNYTEQVNNETNDIVYYELNKFIWLLLKNNPNIIELLNIPEKFIIFKHPIFDKIRLDIFLSKLCENTFAKYAYTQIKKARGLNKKIVNPMDKERRTILDFCYIYEGKEAVPFLKFIESKGWKQENCGLSAIPHLIDCFNLFHSESLGYQGVIRNESANDVSLSSIPKGDTPAGLFYFNKNDYTAYCKKYKDYRDWEQKRNQERYKSTIAHNKNYDSKNLMHTFRLLNMAKEIALEGKVNVYRPDREFLLNIKAGKYEYDELVQKAEELKYELNLLFQKSDLQNEPNESKVNELIINIRKEFYKNNYGNKNT
jgi:hypothetical protein